MAAVDGDVAAVCCGGMVIVDRFDIIRKYLMARVLQKTKIFSFSLVTCVEFVKR